MERLAVLLASSVLVVLLTRVCCDEDHANPNFHDPRNVHNKEHLREHMTDYFDENDMDDQLKMESEEEMEFHYFKLHDYDGNNKLDGLELGAAMTHFHQDGSDTANTGKAAKPLPIGEKELASLVNQILKDDDLNDDGYVDYYEFMKAQREKDML